MNIKEQIIAEIERLKNGLIWGACAAQIEMETNCKAEAYDEVLAFINSLPSDEPSEDLENKIEELHKRFPEVSFAKLSRICVRIARWQKEQMLKDAVEGTVMDFSSNRPRPQVDALLDPHKYHTGDKVKIIIVKED